MCIICTGKYLETKELHCNDCTSLTEIPGLKYLFCYDCTSLTKIPSVETLYCYGCTWIPIQNNKFDSNLQRLSTLQRLWKRTRTGRRLEKLIPAIMGIYYSPDCKGAFLAQKEFEN